MTGSNVRHHFLASYRRSLAQICIAQFQDKGFPHGSAGIRRLMSTGSGKDVLGPELSRIRKLGGHLKDDVVGAFKAFEQVWPPPPCGRKCP